MHICDWILENSSKSHIFISVYLSLPHEHHCILNNISLNHMKFNAQITKTVHEILCKYIHIREISLNTSRNILGFMCDLELFSKIQYILLLSVLSL